jgi:leucyl aminopeptidase (aminopeptidase T)
MKITKERLREIIREVIKEESEYQTFFKKALEKAGKSIPQMSDEEKKAFFNKIDAAWKSKGEKNESVNESLKKFDDVHIKSKNLSGMVYKIQGNTVVVRTIDGLVKAKKSDVTKIQSDNIIKKV